MPPEQQMHLPTTQSYLLSASEESNNLWKIYTMYARGDNKARWPGKKKKKKKVWKEYPEVLNSNLPLEAGPAPVRLGCWELCPTKLWKSPRLNVLKSLWIHVLGLYCSHYQQCFCSCPSGISFATACGTASDLSAQAPTAQHPLISRCATSTHPRQKHLYRQWTSQTQPQNWEPPKQVPPVSWDGWQSHLERLVK